MSTSDAVKVAAMVEHLCQTNPQWRVGWQIWENHELSRPFKPVDDWCVRFETYAHGDIVTVFALHEYWIDDRDTYQAIQYALRTIFPERRVETLDHIFRIHCPYSDEGTHLAQGVMFAV